MIEYLKVNKVNNLKGNGMKITWLLLLGLVAANAYSVQMYQCEDEAGNIQYTQTPSANCVEVKPAPVQSISVPPSEKKAADNSTTASDDHPQASTPPKPQQPQATEENCKTAADILQKIAGNFTLVKSDKNDPNKTITLSKEEVEQERIKAQDYLDKVCKGKPSANQPTSNEIPAKSETNSKSQ